MEVTSLYAGLLGLLSIKIAIETIKARRKHQVSLGGGDSAQLTSLVSAHGNFTSYVPLALILCAANEHSGIYHWGLLHILMGSFLLGRVLHFIAFKGEKMDFPKRILGMHLTLWPTVGLSVLCIYSFIQKTFLN